MGADSVRSLAGHWSGRDDLSGGAVTALSPGGGPAWNAAYGRPGGEKYGITRGLQPDGWKRTSGDSIVQYNTRQPNDFFLYSALINLNRQTVSAMSNCDVSFGGDPSYCAEIKKGIARLYEEAENGDQAAVTTVHNTEARELCSPAWNRQSGGYPMGPDVAGARRVGLEVTNGA